MSPTTDHESLAALVEGNAVFGPVQQVFIAHVSTNDDIVANRLYIWDDDTIVGPDAPRAYICGSGLAGGIFTEQPPTNYPLVLSPSLIIEGAADVGAIRDDASQHSFFAGWIRLPDWSTHEIDVTAQQLLLDVKAWTGWSLRTLADILGITHPTARRILDGEFPSRSMDAIARLHHVHDVLQRLWIVTGRRQRRLRELVATPASDGADSVQALLAQEDWTSAYSLGLRLTNGPLPDMLAASPNASSLDATSFVDDASVWV